MIDKSAAEKACLESAILKALTERAGDTRKQLEEDLGPGDKLATDMGYVQVVKARDGHRVTDEGAFLAWVEANQPDELIVTTTVNPAFRDWVLKRGGLPVGDELEPVDGIEVKPGSSTLRVVPSDAAKKHVSLLIDGALITPGTDTWPEVGP